MAAHCGRAELAFFEGCEMSDFKFIGFNPSRAMRGKGAARVEYSFADVPNDCGWLWMNRQDIKENMRLHGAHPELQKALDAYEGWQ